MASSFLSLLLTLVSLLLFLSLPNAVAQPVAPAPEPAGPVNLTGILEKGGQFTTFIHLLNVTQIDKQVNSQVNSSTEGMTVFSPTDNAFQNLKPGTLNQLNSQQQVQLILYHITPKYYTLDDLLSVSNPVRTQVSGQDDGVFGLNFTGQGNQVNVSTGVVETQINNALRQQLPLAVYVVDKVLLPEEFFGEHKLTPPPPPKPVSSDAANATNSSKKAPAPASNSGSGGRKVGRRFVLGLALLCMKVLF